MADPSPQHQITIGTDLATSADIAAALIRGDVKSGVAEPPGDHVKYDAPAGVDKNIAPAAVNAAGKASCGPLARAAAPFVDASHVGAVAVPQADGTVAHHTFLVADAKPGDAPIVIGGDGKAITPIPADRIIDPSVPKGMNGGKPLPVEVYQGAALSPIWPAHVDDLSHVHAPAADRAAEGQAFQGAPRLHTPTTPEGASIAAVSHLAARNVTPPATHEPRPLTELYPGHPVLSEVGKLEDELKRTVGWPTTLKMAEQYHAGLTSIAAGVNPAPLPSDPMITDEHKRIAVALKDHVETLAKAGGGDASAVKTLEKHATGLQEPRLDAPHDVHATIISEVDAMLPGATPAHVRQHIRARQPEIEPYFISLGDADRGDDFGLHIALSLALESCAVGHPTDGRRPPRPVRSLDPRMGAGPAPSVPAAGGGSANVPGSGGPGGSSGGGTTPGGGPGSGGGMGGHPLGGGPHGEEGGGPHEGSHGWSGGGGFGRFGLGLGLGGVAVDDTDDDDTDDDEVVDTTIAIPGQTRVVRGADRVVQLPGQTRFVAGPSTEYVQGQTEYVAAPPAQHWWQRFGRPSAPTWQSYGRPGYGGGAYGSRPSYGRPNAGPGYNAYGGSAAGEARAQSRVAGIGNAVRSANANPGSISTAQAQQLAHTASQNLASVIRNDPNMRGIGDWFRGRETFVRPDRYLTGYGPDRRLRLLIERYRTDPWTRARLDAGGIVDGLALSDVQAAVALPPVMLDPVMGLVPPSHYLASPGKSAGGSGFGGGYRSGGFGGGYSGGGYGSGWMAQQQAAAQQAAIIQAAQQAAAQQQAIDAANTPLLPTPFDPSMMGGFGNRGRSFASAMVEEDENEPGLLDGNARLACGPCGG